MLGPVVELELVDSLEKVPEGVEISIRHFLTVPHSAEAREALDNPEDQHHVVKLSKVNGKLELQIIDSIQSVTSEYFTTRKLSGQSLCFVTMMFPLNLCWHSSVKEIIFTKHAKKCSHEGYSLNVYCVCPSAKEVFEKQVEKRGHEIPGDAVMTQDIDKSSDTGYHISIRLRMRDNESEMVERRKVNHLEMCEYAGIRKLGGLIEQTFGCGCKEEAHCGRSDAAIFVQVEERKGKDDRIKKTDEDSFALSCEKKDITQRMELLSQFLSQVKEKTFPF